MIRTTAMALCAALALTAGTAPAADRLKIGAAMPEFSGLETAEGKSLSTSDLKDKDVIVVCVTCNHCPMAIAYEDRNIAFSKKHAGKDAKVAFVALCASSMEADGLAKMSERAKDKGFNHCYAFDAGQKVARSLGATKTPEYFVFDKNRKLVYTGAFDDNGKDDKVTKHYVEEAVVAALHGEAPAVKESKAVGCGIAFEKTSK